MKALADRGHHVMVAVNALQERKHARLELIGDERIAILGEVPERLDRWMPLARAVRGTMDFVRYFHPRFADAPALRTGCTGRCCRRCCGRSIAFGTLSESSLARLMRFLQPPGSARFRSVQ